MTRKTYRVLRGRFVPARGVVSGPQAGHREFTRGQTFEAAPSALLRRAVRDRDLEIVEPGPAEPPAERRQRK